MDTTRSDSPLQEVAEVSVRDSPYDRIASIYNRQFGCFAQRVLPVLERLLLGSLPKGAAILDVCCGTGQLAAALVERGFKVTGVDGSAEMLRLARQNAPAARFLHGDVRAMQLKQGFHAAVSTFDSINHILTEDQLASTLARIYQALRPGGLLVFDLNMEEGFRWRWWGSRQGLECGQEYHIRAVYSPREKIGHNIVTLQDRQGTGSSELRIAERCYSEREVRSSLAAALRATTAASGRLCLVHPERSRAWPGPSVPGNLRIRWESQFRRLSQPSCLSLTSFGAAYRGGRRNGRRARTGTCYSGPQIVPSQPGNLRPTGVGS